MSGEMAPCRRLVDAYAHRLSVTCRIGSVRDILEHAGHSMTEAMLFGLSNSLHFTYRMPDETTQKADYLLLTGQWHNNIEDLVANLGLDYHSIYPQDERERWEHVGHLLAQGHPVMLDVVMSMYIGHLESATLPTFNHPESEAERQDFVSSWGRFFNRLQSVAGLHMIVLVGMDQDRNVAYVVEFNLSRIQKVPLDVIKLASNPPTQHPLHPQGRYGILYVPKRLPDLGSVARSAIRCTAHRMLYAPFPGDGVAGVEKLARDLKHWPEMLPQNVVENTMFLIYYLSEKASGSGMYRRIYARFLQEAADLLRNEELARASKDYHALSRKWRELANLLLKGTACVEETLASEAVDQILREIADRERRNASLLESISNGWVEQGRL